MSQYNNKKNPPWARPNSGNQQNIQMNSSNQLQQSMMPNNMTNVSMQNSPLLQYPNQQAMFQNQMSGFQQPMYGGVGTMGAISYPTRALNTAAFQNNAPQNSDNIAGGSQAVQAKQQRVFTGTVTKLQDNFGFVDEDVFFQTSCCVKGMVPQIGDRVLVEALYNASMPFKWNATRIQVFNNRNTGQNQQNRGNLGYNAVPPPCDKMEMDSGGGNRFSSGGSRFSGGGGSGGARSGGGGGGGKQNDRRNNTNMNRRNMRDDSSEIDRKRPRKDKPPMEKDRKLSPIRDRKKSKSPIRPIKRRRIIPRYSVQIPKIALQSLENDIVELKRKYGNMYIPSDFFMCKSKWVSSFPIEKPFSLDYPCKFHIFCKEVEPLDSIKPIPEPTDIDYLFSAKVILMASPGLEDIYKRCMSLADDRERSHSFDDDDLTLPARLIQFLVGQRGKEPLAIGGPWSASLDGDDPESDPGVLIKTAIRTCLSLTGIDLSNCTHWYRFLEIYYHRGETVHKGKTVPARVETVVLFIPDVWSCLPTRPEWDSLQSAYTAQMMRKLNKHPEEEKMDEDDESGNVSSTLAPGRQPMHYSELDPKTMKVSHLKEELELRNLSLKGLKNQLVARLSKALKNEADSEEGGGGEQKASGDNQSESKGSDTKEDSTPAPAAPSPEKEDKKEKREEEEKKKLDDKEIAMLEKKFKLPDSPQILVHPNRNAKSGKFDCSVMSLFSLLSYRPEDNKEHSFEMFLFAEMFNAMLIRDFGFHIFRAIHVAPEKPKDDSKDKDDKDKKKDKSKESKDKEDKDEKNSKDTKDDDVEEVDDDDKSEKKSVSDKKEDKREEKKVKLITVDPFLLLSFIYLDTTRCGYIYDKDLEDLISCLGLSLSRSQIKKLIQKVVVRDSLHYRKLTDKPKDETSNETTDDQTDIKTLSQGNRELLPMFDEDKKSGENLEKLESGFVLHNGTLVDVGKLLKQLERNESSRQVTDKLYSNLLHEHNKLKENHNYSLKSVREINSELNEYKDRLAAAIADLNIKDAKIMRYLQTFYLIRDAVDPIMKDSARETSEEVDAQIKKEKSKSHKEEPMEEGDVPAKESTVLEEKKQSEDEAAQAAKQTDEAEPKEKDTTASKEAGEEVASEENGETGHESPEETVKEVSSIKAEAVSTPKRGTPRRTATKKK